jgi:hypothetical protein
LPSSTKFISVIGRMKSVCGLQLRPARRYADRGSTSSQGLVTTEQVVQYSQVVDQFANRRGLRSERSGGDPKSISPIRQFRGRQVPGNYDRPTIDGCCRDSSLAVFASLPSTQLSKQQVSYDSTVGWEDCIFVPIALRDLVGLQNNQTASRRGKFCQPCTCLIVVRQLDPLDKSDPLRLAARL